MDFAEVKQAFCAEFAGLTDALGIAAVNGDVATIAQLHQQAAGKNVVLRDLWRANGFVRLHAAVAGGYIAVLQLLKEQEIINDHDCNFICISGEAVGSMISVAVVFDQIAVIEWMASSDPDNLAFGINGLIHFAMQLKRFATLQWALDRHVIHNMVWFMCEDQELLEWFARRLPLEKFVVHINGPQLFFLMHGRKATWTLDEQKKFWVDVNYRKSELTTILVSKQHGLRLPPELWELVEEYFT